MNSQGCGCSETLSESHVNLIYKEDPYEEDMFEEEQEWKRQQEKVVRFQSKIIPKLVTRPMHIRVKRFKQKIR